MHDDLESAGRICLLQPAAEPYLSNILWGVSGNYRSISTDCPQRDERQGWWVTAPPSAKGETYLFNTAALYAKWLQDMARRPKRERERA